MKYFFVHQVSIVHLIYQTERSPGENLIQESMTAESVLSNLLLQSSRKLTELLLFSFPFS